MRLKLFIGLLFVAILMTASVVLPAASAWATTVTFSRTNVVIPGAYNQAQFTVNFSAFNAPAPQNLAELHIEGAAFRSSYQGQIPAQTTPVECGNTGIFITYASGSPSLGTNQQCGIVDWSFGNASIIVITNRGDSVTFTFSPGSVYFTSTAPNGGYRANYITNSQSPRGTDVPLTLDMERTVTFDPNGGTGSMSPQTASSPSALSTNTFARSGFSFGNWNSLANSQGATYANNAVYPFAQTQTLYAQWTPLSYTVTYDSQGGSTVPASSYLTGGSLLLAPPPIKSGSHFAGWFTTSTGGSALSNPFSPSGTGPITLFAHWTPDITPGVTPTAIVRPSGETNNMPFLVRGQSALASGYLTTNLVGLTSPSSTVSSVTASTSGSSCGSSGITVYFLTGSPSLSGPSSAACLVDNVGSTARVRIGVVAGDQVEIAVATGALGFLPPPSQSAGATYRVETEVAGSGGTFISALTNTWQLVTFNSNNGQHLSTYEYAQEPNTLSANTFSLTGYTFNNWNTLADGTGQSLANSVSYNFTSNLTLFAMWTPNTYNVFFDTQGGGSVSSETFQSDGSITLPAAPSKPGAAFTGWFAAPTGGAPLPATYFPGQFGNVTLYAHWEALAKTGFEISQLIFLGTLASLVGLVLLFVRRRLFR